MTVIDKILSEWSYRCSDGIVDMNNPDKVKILVEILKPLLKEDIDDDILDILINTDASTKEKMLKQLQKSSKDTSKDLQGLLANKKLGSLSKNVIFDARETGQEDDLVDYTNKLEPKVINTQTPVNTNNTQPEMNTTGNTETVTGTTQTNNINNNPINAIILGNPLFTISANSWNP
jgi:hypothetical protein